MTMAGCPVVTVGVTGQWCLKCFLLAALRLCVRHELKDLVYVQRRGEKCWTSAFLVILKYGLQKEHTERAAGLIFRPPKLCARRVCHRLPEGRLSENARERDNAGEAAVEAKQGEARWP